MGVDGAKDILQSPTEVLGSPWIHMYLFHPHFTCMYAKTVSLSFTSMTSSPPNSADLQKVYILAEKQHCYRGGRRMVFSVLQNLHSFQRYLSFCILQITNWWPHSWLHHWDKSQNEEYLWVEWVNIIIIETWHQYCALRKTQDEAYRIVAMATVLAPVLWTKHYHLWLCNERRKDPSQTYTMPTLCLVSSWTIKEWRIL